MRRFVLAAFAAAAITFGISAPQAHAQTGGGFGLYLDNGRFQLNIGPGYYGPTYGYRDPRYYPAPGYYGPRYPAPRYVPRYPAPRYVPRYPAPRYVPRYPAPHHHNHPHPYPHHHDHHGR